MARRCQCEFEREEQRQKQDEAARSRLKAERLFRESMLNERFKSSTLSRWIQRSGTENIHNAAVSYLKNWDYHRTNGEGLLLFGNAGCGKSHLAAAIVNELLTDGKLGVFANVPDLLEKIRDTFNGNGSKQEIMSTLQRADLLVLDDAGAEKWSDWVEQTLYSVINGRYNNKKPIIITTNCSLQQLEAQIGFRAFDRIIETCLLVECKASSYRREIARERLKR